jgi:hypothetical protein
MNWSRRKEEERLCLAWLKDPLMNPETGRAIERDGTKWKQYQLRCRKIGLNDKPVATGVMTWRKCQEWRKHPGVNPETGRRLTPGGPTYKNIEKQCVKIEKDVNMNILGSYPRPDSNGLVPAHIESGVVYILRNHEGRAVYGPLNRFNKKAVKVYYKDTWDYKYGHYKPIFIGGREPPRPVYGTVGGTSSRSFSSSSSSLAAREREISRNRSKAMVDSFLDVFMK